MEFGPRFKELLKRHGITQSKFANDTHTHSGLVSRYLSGGEQPSGEFIKKAVGYFPDVDLNYLFGDLLQTNHVSEAKTEYKKAKELKDIVDEMEDKLKELRSLLPQN